MRYHIKYSRIPWFLINFINTVFGSFVLAVAYITHLHTSFSPQGFTSFTIACLLTGGGWVTVGLAFLKIIPMQVLWVKKQISYVKKTLYSKTIAIIVNRFPHLQHITARIRF